MATNKIPTRRPGATPARVRRLYETAVTALREVLQEDRFADLCLQGAAHFTRVANDHTLSEQERAQAQTFAYDALCDAAERLNHYPQVGELFGPRLFPWLAVLSKAMAFPDRDIPQWPGGLRLEALFPGQRSRIENHNGARVHVPNNWTPDEIERLLPYLKWEAATSNGQQTRQQGKAPGDGATWASLDDFLDDLFTTLERKCEESGTRFGHSPVEPLFLQAMRGFPGASLMYRWLQKAGLRAQDIKSGKITRENYREFATR